MEVTNPRRILAVSLADSAELLSNTIKDLTGTHPTTQTSSLAGTTHDLTLSTPYYTATVPVWLDLTDDPSEWAATFLSDEAREVRDALGAVVVIFPVGAPDPQERAAATRRLVKGVGKVVRDGLGGWEWDGVSLGLGVGEVGEREEVLDEWEDACAEWGLEFVHVPPTARRPAGGGEEEKRNEYGEKTGMSRVLEALQANDWSQAGLDEGSDDDFLEPGTGKTREDDEDKDELDPENLDFGFDREDFVGLRQAIWNAGREGGDGGDEEFMNKPGVASKNKAPAEDDGADDGEDHNEEIGEEDVQKLEGMMKKLLAVRDMSAGLPEEQRKRMAKKAVADVMKEL